MKCLVGGFKTNINTLTQTLLLADNGEKNIKKNS